MTGAAPLPMAPIEPPDDGDRPDDPFPAWLRALLWLGLPVLFWGLFLRLF